MMMNHRLYPHVLLAAVLMVTCASATFAGTVTRVWWNPSHGGGTTDPFPGQTTDAALATPGDIIPHNLSRYGNYNTLGFSDCPSSFDTDYYFTFSVTPGPNQQIDLPDLLVEFSDYLGHPINPDKVLLRTSLDNFTQDFTAATGPNSLKGNTGGPVVFQLDALPAFSQTVDLRIYPFNLTQNKIAIIGTVATSGNGMWFSNVPTSTIPEPASVGLFTAAGLALVRRRGR